MNIKIYIHLSLNCSPQSLSKQTSNSQGFKAPSDMNFSMDMCVYMCV